MTRTHRFAGRRPEVGDDHGTDDAGGEAPCFAHLVEDARDATS